MCKLPAHRPPRIVLNALGLVDEDFSSEMSDSWNHPPIDKKKEKKRNHEKRIVEQELNVFKDKLKFRVSLEKHMA